MTGLSLSALAKRATKKEAAQERSMAYQVARELRTEELDQISGGCATTMSINGAGDGCDWYAQQ